MQPPGPRAPASSSVTLSVASTQPSGSSASRSCQSFASAIRAERTLKAMAKVEKKRALSEDRLRDFLREMLLIRRFEEKVEERFRAGDLAGFLHVAIGQEAAEVGVCAAMEDGDVFGSTHRAHGHTLARGTHPNALMAELYGKMEGCSHGYGGSMHLYDVERGNLGANAVVGGGIPSLVGAGLAFKLRDEPRVAVAFFGDGATNTGTFHESLNLAQLWNTRTLFVCENNEWAESTPGWQHSPVWNDMSKRALAYDMHSIKVDGQDVEKVYEKASEALDYVRSGAGPVFLDVETYRMHGHYIGDAQPYRSKEDRDEAAERDPIVRLREKLEVSDRGLAGARGRGGGDRRGRRRVREERHRPAARRRAEEHLRLTPWPRCTYREAVNDALAHRDARRRGRLPDGRGHRRDGRLDGRHPGPLRGVRRRARAEHADLRDGDRRRRDRCGDAGDAARRRDHVRGLPHALARADREPGGEAPLHVGRAAEGAADDPHPGRCRLVAGRPARAAARSVARTRPGPQGRLPLDAGRRARPSLVGDLRRQPGDLLRAPPALPGQGRGARDARAGPARQGAGDPRGHATSP